MKKCDFCIKSDSKGNCYYQCQGNRERYCKEAIELMCKTLKCFNKLNYDRDRVIEEYGDE